MPVSGTNAASRPPSPGAAIVSAVNPSIVRLAIMSSASVASA